MASPPPVDRKRANEETPKTSFLDLPPELREIIYCYTFTEPAVFTGVCVPLRFRLPPSDDAPGPHYGNVRANTGLLFTCRTIHRESVKLYYKLTPFEFHSSYDPPIIMFFKCVSPEYRVLISDVRIKQAANANKDVGYTFRQLKQTGIQVAEGVLKTNYFVDGVKVWAAEDPVLALKKK